jgi:2-dehydropantoate 2-reductase
VRILIFGAGVLGTFYGAKLSENGNDVTVLARGRRAEQVRADGLIIEERGRGKLRARVRTIDVLEPDDAYDYVLVLVRNDQIDSVLSILAASTATPNVVFMYNNAAGPQRLIEALGSQRVMLGFPGAGGEKTEDGTVRATVVIPAIQETTIGELDGSISLRVQVLADRLQRAGFPTAISSDMDAWLKTHVAIVSSIADAFYAADSDIKALANNRSLVVKMVRAIQKAFAALRAQGIPIAPSQLKIIELLPEWMLVSVCCLALRTSFAELIIARHAIVAREEMVVLAEQLRVLIAQGTDAVKQDSGGGNDTSRSHWQL